MCGSAPNDNVTLPLDKIRDASVLDAKDICDGCATEAARLIQGKPK